jgi:WD40 repeat protein
MKRTVFFAMALLGTALLLASANTPALGKDILLQGMLHNKFNVIDGDKDEVVATIETKGKKVTNFTWDPKDLDKIYTITDWGQQIEQLDLKGKRVVRTFRTGSGDVKVRSLDIEINPAHPNLLYALSLRQRWLPDEIVDMTPEVIVFDVGVDPPKIVKEIEIPRGCTNIFFGYDGSEFYVTGRDVFVYDPMSGKQVNFLGIGHPTTTGVDPQISLNIWRLHDQSGMAMILVGSQNSVSNLMYQGYYTIDLRKKSTEGSMHLVTDIGPFYIQFSGVISPDRKYYYTVLNKIEKRDFKTNRVLATAEDLDKSYYTIQVSSDGKKVYLGGGGDTILIYDTDTMKLLKRLDTPGDAVLTHFRVQHR